MRTRHALIPFLMLIVTLLAAAPALADTYTVTGTGDGPADSCQSSGSGTFVCATLRDAATAANATTAVDDVIILGEGTYTLTEPSAIELTDNVVVAGLSARETTIQGSGSTRVLEVDAPTTASLTGLTIRGGDAGFGSGGNILTSGDLTLSNVRVTGGTADSGGGIANTAPGTLTIENSLVDDNGATSQAGGILSLDQVGQQANLLVTNSTVAFNEVTGASFGAGGGIVSDGSEGGGATLTASTIAFNRAAMDPGGIDVLFAGSVAASGSIVAGNISGAGTSNCVVGLLDQGGNLEDGSTACFGATAADPQLSPQLVDLGGHTDVLSIPATSPAKGIGILCAPAIDQRLAPRPTTGCDAGSFQEGAVAPPLHPTSPPPPTTPPPTTPPVTTPPDTTNAVPAPTFGRAVVVVRVSGKVLVRRRGSTRYVAVETLRRIPVGSIVDARKGHVSLTAIPKQGAAPTTAVFWDGVFRVTQHGGVTILKLVGPLAVCKPRARHAASTAKRKPKVRRLWGNGKGAFRTQGKYSSATVRGTKWLVQDSCAGTLTRVARGVVTVRDTVRKRTVIVRAGHRYLARPRRR